MIERGIFNGNGQTSTGLSHLARNPTHSSLLLFQIYPIPTSFVSPSLFNCVYICCSTQAPCQPAKVVIVGATNIRQVGRLIGW